MAKNETKATTSKKDRSNFKKVALDSYLWRGASAKSPLIGRVVGKEELATKYKSAKNPEGIVPAIIVRCTEPSSWLAEDGSLVEAPVDSDVKVVLTAGLEAFGRKALLALASGKAPEVVLGPTGQTKSTPNGAMKLYSLEMEPIEEWPALSEFAGDSFPVDFEVSQLAAPTAKQLTAGQA